MCKINTKHDEINFFMTSIDHAQSFVNSFIVSKKHTIDFKYGYSCQCMFHDPCHIINMTKIRIQGNKVPILLVHLLL